MTNELSPTGAARPTSARIKPVGEVDDALAEILKSGISTPGGQPLNIFATIGHHPRLLKRFMSFAGLFLNTGLLPAREREIVILRVGWNCQSVYEFGQHTIIGRRVGLSDEEIFSLTGAIEEWRWTPRDAALIRMSDDLCRDDCVSQPVWDELMGEWSEAQMVELVMLAGTYRLVSGFLNSFGVEREATTPGWPV